MGHKDTRTAGLNQAGHNQAGHNQAGQNKALHNQVGQNNAGFSLVELSVACFILSVGSLAVLTLSLHWHSSFSHATARMKAIDQLIEERPPARIERRYEFFSCERDK